MDGLKDGKNVLQQFGVGSLTDAGEILFQLLAVADAAQGGGDVRVGERVLQAERGDV